MRGVYHGIHGSEARRAAEAGQKGKQAASGQCFTKRFVTITPVAVLVLQRVSSSERPDSPRGPGAIRASAFPSALPS